MVTEDCERTYNPKKLEQSNARTPPKETIQSIEERENEE